MTGPATSPFPLTGAQAGVWMAQQLNPATRSLFLSQSVELAGPVDVVSFRAAVRQAFTECDALRLRIGVSARGFQQEVRAAGEVDLPLIDVSGADARERATAWMRADLIRPADLTGNDLFRSALLKLAPDQFIWYQRCHHVLLDGYSSWLLARRVAVVYTALVRQDRCPPASFGPFRALVEEEAAYRGSSAFERDKAYWNTRLADRPDVVGLVPALAAPADDSLRTTSSLPAEAAGILAAIVGHSDGGWPVAVIAAVAAYLHRVTGTQDVILGLPVTARRTPASLRTPGMLANVLPLRLDVRPHMSIAELIRLAAQQVSRLLRHQRYSQEMLRRDLGLLDSGGRLCGPEVNIMSVDQRLDFAGIAATLSNVNNGPVEDTSVYAYRDPRDNQLKIDYTANPRCYSAAEVAGHAARFTHFFGALAAHAGEPIGGIDFLRPGERQRALTDREDTRQPDQHGDVDYRALPPADVVPATAALAPPGRGGAGREEAILRAVFADVLGVPDVGAGDSFFAVGGDSISAIQAVTRAAEAGLVITPRDVFQLKTPQALAQAAAALPAEPAGRPDDGVGFVPATPAMHWLREIGGPIDGFHQSVLVNVPAGLTLPSLHLAVQSLLDRHDMLRARLERSGDSAVWGLHVRPAGTVRAESCVKRADLSGQDGAGWQPVLADGFTAARACLAPGQGEMVQVVWFDHGAERPGQLLLVIHHLVMDGVSWRILLPDLRDAWQCAAAGRDIVLKPAGTSFRRWSEGLLIAAQDPRWASTLPAWTRMLPGPASRIGRRPRDRDTDVAGRTRSITLDLDARVTDALLTQVPGAFTVSVRDVLLTGLALAVAEAGSERSVLIDLEGHGREDVVDGADVTSTIGWFTSIFPVRIDLGEAAPGPRPITGELAVAMVKDVKEQLGGLPAGGAAYGLLRYLNPVTGPVLAALPVPEVCFNYLGRFSVPEDDDGGEPWLPRADTGALAAPASDLPVAHLLEAVAVTLARRDGARLAMALTWPEEAMDASGAERVAYRWVAILQLLAEHVAATGAVGLTPSDLPLLTLRQTEIDEFESMY